jgi:hypothetical protein
MPQPTRKKPKPRLCSHCKRYQPARGFHHHVRVCAILQSVDLPALWKQTQNLSQLAKQLHVSRSTLTKWLDNLNIQRTPGPPPARPTTPLSITVHGLAILHPPPYGGCPNCPAAHLCSDIVQPHNLAWILCEAPDPRQLAAWKRNGISIPDLTTALRRIQPTLEAAL